MEPKLLIEESITRVEFREINFLWRIENFTLLNKGIGQFIKSQIFPKSEEDQNQWCLQLYPFGEVEDARDNISLYLKMLPKNINGLVAQYKLNFQNTNESLLKSSGFSTRNFSEHTQIWGYSKFAARNEILPHLVDNVLLVNCSIKWEADIINFSKEVRAIAKPDVQENLSNNLHELKNKGSFSDVCLLANDGSKFPVHKFMLVARSPVFAAMFEHDMKESSESVVKIEDINAEVLKHMLEFIYSGRFEVDENEVWLEGILAAADKYNIEDLKILCELALGNQLSVDNAVCYLMLADHHSAKTLKSQVVEFISTHLKQVLGSEAMKNLTVAQKALFYEVLQNVADKIKII